MENFSKDILSTAELKAKRNGPRKNDGPLIKIFNRY